MDCTKSDENIITACEMKFMRRTAGRTKWDLKTNEKVLTELSGANIGLLV
jgi:hypothetical protein